MSIPAEYLDKVQGASWKDVRINVSVFDHDLTLGGIEGGPGVQLWWKRGWGDGDLGSGTFVRTP